MSRSVGDTIRRNAMYSMIAWFAQQGSKLILIPIIWHFLHPDGYALINVPFLIMGYFTLQAFGINNAFVKYTAECYVTQDYRRLSTLLSTGMAIAVLLGLLTVLVTALFTDAIVAWLRISTERMGEARYCVMCVGVVSAVTIAFGVYQAAIMGIQRIDLLTNTRMLFALGEFVAIVVLLYRGFGVKAVMTVYSTSLICVQLSYAVMTRKFLPEVRINPFRARREGLGPVLSLGGRMQLLGLTSILMSSLDGLVLARYEGLTFTGAYQVARRLVHSMVGLPQQTYGPLIPASADLHSREDQEKLARVFGAAMRLLAVGSAYLFAYTAVNSDFLILGIFGPQEYSPWTVLALSFLCCATFFHILTGPGSSMLRGAGKPALEMAYQILAILLFLACFTLARFVDSDVLAVLSFPSGLALASILFIMLSNRYFGAPWHNPFGATILLILAGPAAGWLARQTWHLMPFGYPDTRWEALAIVAVTGILYTILFTLAVWRVPGLTADDKRQLVRLLPFRRRIENWWNRRRAPGSPAA